MFKPDMVKIYPTVVLQGTSLHKLYQNGRYHAYHDNDLIDVLIAVKKMVPPWVRIMRIQREIENKDIVAGPKSGNLRQILIQKLEEKGLKCRCIRCRELGLQRRNLLDTEIKMNRIDYYASKGHEVFLSFENLDRSVILGFLRLRKIFNPYRKELKGEDNSDTARHCKGIACIWPNVECRKQKTRKYFLSTPGLWLKAYAGSGKNCKR